MRKEAQIVVRMDEEDAVRLRELAQSGRVSVSWVVREAISAHLDGAKKLAETQNP